MPQTPSCSYGEEHDGRTSVSFLARNSDTDRYVAESGTIDLSVDAKAQTRHPHPHRRRLRGRAEDRGYGRSPPRGPPGPLRRRLGLLPAPELRARDLDGALPEADWQRLPLPWSAGFLAGRRFGEYRRRGGSRPRPLPDFYIGAHAAVEDLALITRDVSRFKTYFPTVALVAPDEEAGAS